MPRKSPYRIDIPQVNILTYLFGSGNDLSNTPLWIDSADASINLSMKQMFNWSKRLAIGLDQLGIKPGSVVLIYSPNHIYIPAAYLGIVGSGRIFSGVNPIYTLPGIPKRHE
jgi:4-coumarate--CoA ligase